MDAIKRVLLVGGTHGNELIGIHLVRKFEHRPTLVARSSFETLTLLGNPRAIEKGSRYIDKDLNRCFDFQAIQQKQQGHLYEIQRAREISQKFGSGGQLPVDLIVDQHSTTANAGIMLILDSLDTFTLKLVAYLNAINPDIKIYSSAKSGRKRDSLRSITNYRICIEVGPLAHGTLQSELFQQTEALVYGTLDYVERYNNGSTISLEKQSLTLYNYIGMVDYPRNQIGDIQATIHPQRQYQDYKAMNPGDPMFLTFDGGTITYQGDTTVYPIFINEAAYYEKGIAMVLTEKQNYTNRHFG
ncbi:aspartoacylase [Leptothoe spongobia]|uniref:Probable aspartoacylase n=1 Tax=Leptothoe spongobia TAU-MAC 1115 TaxID=1967444 RepID=A0A947DLP4_9CYAN|nr:aspartoacylase [Leptothoe spongobia]MBT9317924.1 aspartoacylase [Leptothoe spongobia TAU-MAC 1115]